MQGDPEGMAGEGPVVVLLRHWISLIWVWGCRCMEEGLEVLFRLTWWRCELFVQGVRYLHAGLRMEADCSSTLENGFNAARSYV